MHNGHITNYHQLRRRYEQRGVRFYTENDSEIVAIYLAEQLERRRGSRGGAEAACLHDLDGSFSCLAATDTELGFVKGSVLRSSRCLLAEIGRICGGGNRRDRDPRGDAGQLRSARGAGEGSPGMADIDCDGPHHARDQCGDPAADRRRRADITMQNPGARHNLAVAVLAAGPHSV